MNVAGSACAFPASPQGYVFNATVIPSPALPYLTLWPDGESQPVVSTLNAGDGSITSNMAVVPNVNGKVDAYAQGNDAVDSRYLQLLRAVMRKAREQVERAGPKLEGLMKKLSVATLLLLALIFLLAAAVASSAQTLTTLHNFTGADGDGPGSFDDSGSRRKLLRHHLPGRLPTGWHDLQNHAER